LVASHWYALENITTLLIRNGCSCDSRIKVLNADVSSLYDGTGWVPQDSCEAARPGLILRRRAGNRVAIAALEERLTALLISSARAKPLDASRQTANK
jgi:hypothetical protein